MARGGKGRGNSGYMRSMEVRSVFEFFNVNLPAHRCSAMNKARLTGFPASTIYQQPWFHQ